MAEPAQVITTRVSGKARDATKWPLDRVRRAAQQQRIASASDDCRNALQMVVGLHQLADDLGRLPADGCPPGFAQDLGILSDGIERRLSRAVEQIERGWLTSRPGARGRAAHRDGAEGGERPNSGSDNSIEVTNGYHDRARERGPEVVGSIPRLDPAQLSDASVDGGGDRMRQDRDPG